MFDKNRFINLFEESEAAEVIDEKRAIEDYKDVVGAANNALLGLSFSGSQTTSLLIFN